MTTELTGMLPRMPYDYASKCVDRATLDAYRQNAWSFLTFESNWTSPAWVQNGTVSVAQGSSTIQFDPLIATPAINAIGLVPSAVTQRQFRIGIGTIYNIWTYSAPSGTVDTAGTAVTAASGDNFLAGIGGAWIGLLIAIAGVSYSIVSVASDGLSLVISSSAGSHSGSTFQVGGIATLDRNYQEITAAASSYVVFQCYYVSPVKDFKGWASVRDMLNYNDVHTNHTRAWADERDPQRTFYYYPTEVWFYENDPNPASSTYGWPVFELLGAPTYQLTYQLYGYRKGVPLVNPSDELPSAIGEDCVMAKARYYGYEWAEANRVQGDKIGNYLRLMDSNLKMYTRLYRDYRRDDRYMVDAFHTRFRRTRGTAGPTYNAIAGVANPGI